MCGNFAAKSGRIDEIDEGSLAADLDDGQPFAVGSLQIGVARDVHLLELLTALGQDGPGLLAEMAALSRVEDDLRSYG